VTTDREASLDHVMREHLGLIEGTAARCLAIRREAGLR
jgi:hypothetical protein